MFNSKLRKEALAIRENAEKRYNSSCEALRSACETLYSVRERSVAYITEVESLVNSIANTPREFEKQLGEIRQQVMQFRKTQEYVMEAYKSAVKSGVGIATGAAAGSAVAALGPSAAMAIATTFTATPAFVASAFTTAVFGIISQASALRSGKLSSEDFLINSEALCLDATISAVSSGLGQAIIPVPILGAVIGNTTGMILYQLAKEQGLAQEAKLIKGYHTELKILDEKLRASYEHLMDILNARFSTFESLMAYAFDSDVNIAFTASVDFARWNGVPEEMILKSKEDIDAFFMM